ncbi:ABC-three component system middle component 6 [Lysinibacillus louembei]|uniref:ABC-three component system middle component 6 n=1 Tax=Lysinibacillus louembei TaxID=1470088 RepID=UPI003873080F
MLIINDLKKPQNTIIYCAACIIFILKKLDKSMHIDTLFNTIKVEYSKNMEYTDFILALDFLFLIEKIKFDKEGKICLLED